MIGRFGCGLFVVLFVTGLVRAQDVPGIEICTAEKTMERRTSCLQSNIALQKMVEELKAAQAKVPDNTKKAETPAKDAASKDAPKDAPKGGAAKEGGK